jgi:4-carboxymuconolactone decarboxylase
MPRLRKFEVGELNPRQRQIYDRLVKGRRAGSPTFPLTDEAGRLEGPCNAWLLSPPLGDAFELLGGAIRFDLSLTPRCREIAILAVAHQRDSPYELFAHRLAGVAAGLSEAEVADLCAGRDPGLTAGSGRATYAGATALLRDGGLGDAAYDDAVAALGETGLFEVTVVVGFYQLTANLLAVFDVTPPEHAARG